MENTAQNAYSEPLCSRPELFWRPQTPQQTTSPTSACSEATVRPHQIEPPAYTSAPYLDSPLSQHCESSPTNASPISPTGYQQSLTFQIYSPAADLAPLSRSSYSDDGDGEEDRNVPLAQFLLYPCDAPPAYSTVVRQSYRETFLQHIPRHPVIVDLDEEAALEMMRADDVSFTIERVVAMAAVIALLLLTGIWVGLVFIRR
ncbi:uncharacterized protein M421DRAFT_421968 [Didymella exigua CBS 183.55]|uniref:Uncharacterized protein n=1 Tax=Didymella exigua CBS 183.55 TaxID=1150837 RepID=A0A6A5RH68_9PLEO|nr:uncharacterized protein M421DRAFT_421968 [Didymella exigua CBS 183.55]KAF1927102.1 hypothetical protein M421DRAFT_421968 [Didymella exigua CBS 183.55]